MRRLVVGILLVGSIPACTDAFAATRTVEIVIEHSAFFPDRLTVAAGETVRFVVVNNDPIDHELIIGDAYVQLVHELGTETHHGAKPGEVSVPAGTTAETVYSFERPRYTLFGCHAPGHYDYGMKGAIEVEA